MVTKPSLTLFDNRAATYEKLNNLAAALRDGKKMLELDKSYAQVILNTHPNENQL